MNTAIAPHPPQRVETTDVPKQRVCHVSLTLKTGGLERLLTDFARFHDAGRYELCFVSMRETGAFAERIRVLGCPVLPLQSRGRLSQILELAGIFRERKIDVVHTHNIYPHIYATLAARLARVPVVVHTRHGRRAGLHDWKSRLQYRAISRLVDRMVAVSQDAARLCTDVDGIPADKVMTIWNGIDLDGFTWRGPARECTAVSVARLSPEKDFGTLLRATALVVQEIPAFRLLMVGDGQERAALEALASELNLEDCVQFLGERHDVPELLGRAGFFVSSSLTEGISLTLLEAMATGLPIVATSVGGNPEVVSEGITGTLVPSADPAALAEAIIEMCRQRNEWEAIGLCGRSRVAEHFDVRKMVASYEDLYDDHLEVRTRSRAGTARN